MPLTLKRKPIFAGFGGPRSALVRLRFQVWISGVCFNVFLCGFYDLGSPLGSLLAPFGHPFLGDLVTSFRIGEQIASEMPKRVTFRCFGVPFLRIWGDISEDSGRNLTTTLDVIWATLGVSWWPLGVIWRDRQNTHTHTHIYTRKHDNKNCIQYNCTNKPNLQNTMQPLS